MDWIDQKEVEIKEERAKAYFDIQEGKQQFVLLSHCAPLPQVFDKSIGKYRAAVEGDTNVSVKGLCWVLQDGLIKQAKLPYTIVKAIRALQQNPDWEFEIPFRHVLTLDAVGAGNKEVKYSLTPSPKKTEIPEKILADLKEKMTPEEIVEKIRGGKSENRSEPQSDAPPAAAYEYPKDDINPEDIPF